MRFAAAAFDNKGRMMGAGWNGAVSEKEKAGAERLTAWLREQADLKNIDPEKIRLVRSNGFHKLMHAEMRMLNNIALARGRFSDIFNISMIQTVPVSANGRYFGVRKLEPRGPIWTTCAPCARVLEVMDIREEMQTTRGWVSVNAATTIINATEKRSVPHNFWDREKETFQDRLRQYDRKNPPPVIETDFMIWQRLDL